MKQQADFHGIDYEFFQLEDWVYQRLQTCHQQWLLKGRIRSYLEIILPHFGKMLLQLIIKLDVLLTQKFKQYSAFSFFYTTYRGSTPAQSLDIKL